MADVIMLCGKICSGKSTYAKKISKEHKAVILSVDEITLALLGRDGGDKLDEYVEKLEAYLFDKSVEIVGTGINVVLDWGLWKRSEREYAKKFYSSRGIDCELYYIEITDEEWDKRIEKRNADISAGLLDAYYVDDGLKEKFNRLFEAPEKNEVDVLVKS